MPPIPHIPADLAAAWGQGRSDEIDRDYSGRENS